MHQQVMRVAADDIIDIQENSGDGIVEMFRPGAVDKCVDRLNMLRRANRVVKLTVQD